MQLGAIKMQLKQYKKVGKNNETDGGS